MLLTQLINSSKQFIAASYYNMQYSSREALYYTVVKLHADGRKIIMVLSGG